MRLFRSVDPPAVTWAAVFYLAHLLCQGKIALSELFAFWTIFFCGWALYRRQLQFSWHILYYPLALYGLISSVSAMTAFRRIHPMAEGTLWFKMLLFPAALILLRSLPALRKTAIYAYFIFGVGIACWGLIEYIFLNQRDLEHRITGPATHVMTFSGLLLPLSLMFLVIWWYERKWWQLAGTGIVCVALLLTFTRSVWLGWIVALFVLFTLIRPRLLLYAAPALIFFITFMPMNLFSRFVSTFDTRQESNLDRIRMLQAGVEIIKDHPLLGVGPANVKEIYALYKTHDAPRFRPPHLHNNIVQLWAELGILGLCAYVLLIVLFLRECARAWRGPRRMWAEIGVAITASLAYAGLFEFNFGDTEVFYLLLDLSALVIACMVPWQPRRLNEPAPAAVPAVA